MTNKRSERDKQMALRQQRRPGAVDSRRSRMERVGREIEGRAAYKRRSGSAEDEQARTQQQVAPEEGHGRKAAPFERAVRASARRRPQNETRAASGAVYAVREPMDLLPPHCPLRDVLRPSMHAQTSAPTTVGPKEDRDRFAVSIAALCSLGAT
eukprot:2647055-Pleurochrysis_carterae.AAC.2